MFTLLIIFGMFGAFFDAVYGNHKVDKIKFGRNKLGIIFLFRSICSLCKDIVILAFRGGKGLFVFATSMYTKSKQVKTKTTIAQNPNIAKVISLNDYKCDKKNKVG